MVKLTALTLLNGLLRSQCIQGMYCQKSNTYLKSPGVTFVLIKDLRSLINNQTILKALDAKKVTSSKIYIHGVSTQDALEFCLATLCVIYNFFPKFAWVFTIKEQLSLFRYIKVVPKRLVLKYQKYITAELPNRYLEQVDHNKVPDNFEQYMPNIFGYTGRVKKFLENRLYRKCGKNLHFWNSWLQGIKRACHEADDSVLYDNYLDHKQTLNQSPTGTLDERVKVYMRRAVEKVRIDEIRLYEASTSASFTTKRSDGGQRADVRNWLLGKYGEATVDRFTDSSRYYELRGPAIPDVKVLARDIVNDFLVDGSVMKPLKVKVHGILEPLKVRKITKGEAVPYWYCRSAQKDLHASLQQFPQFVATGRPIERYDIHSLIDREKAVEEQCCPLGFNGWVSGDYSAATDGVDIRVTMGLLELILQKSKLDENQKDILRAVLGPQKVYYPNMEHKPKIRPFLQKTGQLMGSILSFPILCYINVITYWMSLEQYTGRIFDLKDLPCLVNGDDILFRANEEFYEIWKTNIKKVGFTMSIGKNYFHRNVFLINSQMFRLNGDPFKNYTLDRIPMYNIGLLTGKAKTTGRNYEKLKPVDAWYNEVVAGAYDKYDAHKRFLYYHKEVIDEMTDYGIYNLFIPRWWGGLGLHLYDEVRPHVKTTFYQRCLASYIRRQVHISGLKGIKPTRYINRLLTEDQGKQPWYTTGTTNKPAEAITTIDLGFHENYRVIPLTQPLKQNESLELTRQRALPLLANIPEEFDKPELIVKRPLKLSFKRIFRDIQRTKEYHYCVGPMPERLCLEERQYRLVSVRQETLQEILMRDNLQDNLDYDDTQMDIDEFIVDGNHKSKIPSHLTIVTTAAQKINLRTEAVKALPGGLMLIVQAEE